MDSVTHIVLGACIGEAIAGKRLGKKALLYGAIAQSVPDIDFVSSFWLGTAENLLAHRGFTHSILFAVFVTGLLGYSARKYYRNKGVPLKTWMLLFGINILTHLFIDSFNAYGTGLFEPFSNHRVSFHTLFVADPLFTAWPLIAFIVLIILSQKDPKRKLWWRTSIGISSLYLIYAIANKVNIDAEVKHSLAYHGIPHTKYLTTPTPLNTLLWFVVAGDSSGFYVGYRSVFDSKDKIDFQYFPKRDSLLSMVYDHKELHLLRRFSQGFYTVEKWNDTLVFNDLRFGQIVGWYDAREKFVFHYFLKHQTDNKLVVQRGRFAKWNDETFQSLWMRIGGN